MWAELPQNFTGCYVATSNNGKLAELAESMHEFFPHINPLIGRAAKSAQENGKTFLENARIKAKALYIELLEELNEKNFWVLADDSGLEVDALNGYPGIHSARYAGQHGNDKKNNEKLLSELNAITQLEKRSARYHCALVLLMSDSKNLVEFTGHGICKGFINFEGHGDAGFGYDPLFLLPKHTKSLGQLDFAYKYSFSHRTNAFKDLKINMERHARP